MVDNPGPTLPGYGMPSETTTLISFPCSSLQENKVKGMMSINDEVSIIETGACNQTSSTSTGMLLHSLCTGGSVSTNCENCKDEQSLRVLGSSRSMDENTVGNMYIQLPPSVDCQGTLDKLDISLLNKVGASGAQTDDAIVHNLSTFSTAGRLEYIPNVTTDVVRVKSKTMLQAIGNICSSGEDYTDTILNCSDEKSVSQTCMGLGIVRNGSSKSLDVKEQSEKSCLGTISCSGAVDCTGQSIDAANEIGGSFCIRENDCLASLSSSLQRRYTNRKSSRKARRTVSRKKAVKKACLDETGEFLLKTLRRKRSCPFKPPRSSTWGFSADLIPFAQQIKSPDIGVQNQAVGPQESRKSVKESANKSQKGASKKCQVFSGTLRFKFKVGKDVGRKILNTAATEKDDVSTSAFSSTWGFSADLMPSAQQIKSPDIGVQNQAVGPHSPRKQKSVKESANKSQKGASKKRQVFSGTLRFKFKVGKDVGQKILNTAAIEKDDVSTSADILSCNHITGMKNIVSKFPKSASETKKDLHKERSDHQSKHKKDFVKEDSCPVACCVDPEFETKDVSMDLQEKSADDVVSGVAGIQLVEVEASGCASDDR